MPTVFPGALDTWINPSATDPLTGPGTVPHHLQHDNHNDAISALEAKVGIDSSAVTSSLDYKVSGLIAGTLGSALLVESGAAAKISALSTVTTMGGSEVIPFALAGTTQAISFSNLQTAVLAGNAASAAKLQTARNINGVAFDGTASITVPAAAGTLTGSTLAAGVTASSLTSLGILTALALNGNITLSASSTTIVIPAAGSITTTVGGVGCTAFGNNALKSVTGAHNCGFGNGAGSAITSGTNNTCGGDSAGAAITTESDHTFFGYQAGLLWASTGQSSAFGSGALAAAPGGNTNRNDAFGYFSLNVCTGSENVGFGHGCGSLATTIQRCTYVGVEAGYNAVATTNQGLTLIGYRAGSTATAGGTTGVGERTLAALTTGARNTGCGYQVLNVNVTGADCTGLGWGVFNSSTGASLTGVGSQAGINITSGHHCTLLGDNTGLTLTTGDHCTLIGSAVDVANNNASYRTVIGAGATDNGDNSVTLGRLATDKLCVPQIKNYFNVATAGWGVPAIYASGRSTSQSAAVASVATYTVGAADGTFQINTNLNVTTSTTFSINVQVTYTDETNTSQTLTLNFQSLAGTLLTAITNVQGTGPYEGIPVSIRAKASTAITIKTAGTFTSVVYNVEGQISQIS